MKILNRLRGLFPAPEGIEGQNFERRVEDLKDMTGSDIDLLYHDMPDDTLDGLRRRIPGVHEDFPPVGLSADLNGSV